MKPRVQTSLRIQFIFDYAPEIQFYLNLGAFRQQNFLSIYLNIFNWIEFMEGRSPFKKDETSQIIKLKIQVEDSSDSYLFKS